MAARNSAVVERPGPSPERPGEPPAGRQAWLGLRTPVRRAQWAAAALVVLATCLQQPASVFYADASTYWNATMAILQGGDLHAAGRLELRGIATSFLYLPAGVVVTLAGGAGAAFAVMVQNALLLAGTGAFLLPRFVGIWRPVTPRLVWACALGTGLLLAGFAPIPLTDVWAASLLLAATIALHGRRWQHLLVAGAAAGLAFNLRPAVLLPVAGVVIAVLVARRISGLWFLAGAAAALLPQSLYNLARGTSWLPWPEETFGLSGRQAHWASFTVRYDTLVTPDSVAPLFYCSPSMAQAVEDAPPTSGGGLVAAFLSHPVEASVLSAQKVAAALHWGLAVPYSDEAPGVNALIAVLVTAVAVTGAAVGLHAVVTRGLRVLSLAQVAALLVWVGTLLSLLSAAPESRFALVLVLIGIAGCAALVADGLHTPRDRAGWVRSGFLVVAVLAVFAVGVTGLQHPVEGRATVQDCARA
ncbi:hypothetical protein [Candidatus Blastococcus massiliensis]|uniref:hypothetical protein n=1 Tax=Candidatus Blastococcus massiliensis TaxID=1470358 RepID=UPI00058D55CB|nr:hypothetical protein [Candidatus Blastococcus massiliensis]